MPTDQQLLDRWAGFPAAATPRPVVLIDGYVHVQQGGFESVAAKNAFIAGAVEPAVDAPSPVLDLLRGSRRGFDGPPLTVTDLRRSSAPFNTDRGARSLPAYELVIPGAVAPVVVLDPAYPVWWPPTPAAERPNTSGPVWIEDDDRTLHVPVGGNVLTETRRCEFTETDTAVLVRTFTTERRMDPGTAIPLVLIMKRAVGHLRQPLGGRVLVSENGLPLAVVRVDQFAHGNDSSEA